MNPFCRLLTLLQRPTEPDPYDLSGPIENAQDQFIADEIAKATAMAKDAEELEK